MCTFGSMNAAKTILVAPLNWGMGHATRCIPIIRELKEHGFEVVLGSDGVALALLQKEFPKLECVELPSYHIEYAKKGKYFKWKLLKNSPKMMKAIKEERKQVKALVKSGRIDGIISDNRLGVYHKKVPSVFVTHQLKVLTGTTTWLSTKAHHQFIRKFDECWVPDVAGTPNLSGKLGHPKKRSKNIHYLGPLSRLESKVLPKKYDLMIILSGPEPQRTLLEERLSEEAKHFDGNVLFIRGKMAAKQEQFTNLNLDVYNFMTSSQLERAFNESDLVLCRSGYTTLMDLAKLGKKAFFIPTPGQFEQVYLAKRMKKLRLAPFCEQDEFKIEKLQEVASYQGLSNVFDVGDLNLRLSLFQGE